MKYIFSFLIFISLNQVFAIDSYQANESLNVLTLSGIKLRDKPGGAVLQTIPYAAKIVTLEVKNNNFPVTVEGIKGSWVKVSFNDKIGYVFDGFLSRLPAPSFTDANLRAYVKREFKMISEEIPLSYLENSDLRESGSNVFLFEWQGEQGAYQYHYYSEGGGENVAISGISMEEAYLLVRIVEREAYDYVLIEMEQRPENFDMRPYNGFVLNGTSYETHDDGSITEKQDFYTIDFVTGCDCVLIITKHEKYVLINIDCGC